MRRLASLHQGECKKGSAAEASRLALRRAAADAEEVGRDPWVRSAYRLKAKDVGYTSNRAFDKIMMQLGLRQYISTPPYFSFRLAEGSTGTWTGPQISRLSDYIMTHLVARVEAQH
eukprot:Selendium_serpulae@DN9081_c0_g1_i1.p2